MLAEINYLDLLLGKDKKNPVNSYDVIIPNWNNEEPLILRKVWASTPEKALDYVMYLDVIQANMQRIKLDRRKIKVIENAKTSNKLVNH